MADQRTLRLQKLQVAWLHRKLAIDVKISQLQQQKSKILDAIKSTQVLMQSKQFQDFQFEEFARKHFISLSQKLENLNFHLATLQSQRRDFYGHEKKVEKLHEHVKEQAEMAKAAAEVAEILETVLISADRENRKLATSQK
jgi:hypothetical protein